MSVPSHAKLQLLLLFAAVALMSGVSGHAYLAFPPARNFLISPDYCPQCLSAGGEQRLWERPSGSSNLHYQAALPAESDDSHC